MLPSLGLEPSADITQTELRLSPFPNDARVMKLNYRPNQLHTAVHESPRVTGGCEHSPTIHKLIVKTEHTTGHTTASHFAYGIAYFVLFY